MVANLEVLSICDVERRGAFDSRKTPISFEIDFSLNQHLFHDPTNYFQRLMMFFVFFRPLTVDEALPRPQHRKVTNKLKIEENEEKKEAEIESTEKKKKKKKKEKKEKVNKIGDAGKFRVESY